MIFFLSFAALFKGFFEAFDELKPIALIDWMKNTKKAMQMNNSYPDDRKKYKTFF
jgi:hypothetical protein